MSKRPRLRFAPIIVAAGILASAASHAASLPIPWRIDPGRAEAGASLRGLLAEALGRLSAIWEKEGSSIDPFGQPKPGDSDPSGQRPAPAPPELPGE